MSGRLAAAALLVVAACAPSQPAPPPSSSPSAQASAPSTPTPVASITPVPQAQRDEPPLPAAREETAAASAGGRLFVIGGFDAAGASRPEVYVFDGTAWSPGPALPLGLDHPSAAVLDGRVVLAGGFSAGVPSARVLRLDGDRWTDLAPLHHARGALGLAAAAGRLYAMGGTGAANVGPAEALDPATGAWSDVPALPQPRNHVAPFTYRDRPCVAGGRSPDTTRVECFDGAAWTALPALPAPTSGAGAGTLEGMVVVAGGEDPAETRIVEQLAVFAGGSWTSGAMRSPRHGFQLAPFGGRLWACGGGAQAGLHPVATCTSILPGAA